MTQVLPQTLELSKSHVSSPRIYRFLAGSLPPDEGSEVLDHCSRCVLCERHRVLLASLRLLANKPVMQTALLQEHQCPSEVALKQYLDGLLPSRYQSRVSAHLTHCSPCKELITTVRRYEAGSFDVLD